MSGPGDAAAAPTGNRTGRRYEIGAWVLVIVLALALLVWRIAGRDRGVAGLHPVDLDPPSGSRARVGASYRSESAQTVTDRHAGTVRLPVGTVYLTVSTPAGRVMDGHGDEHRPPRGGSFVQLDSQLDPRTATIPTDDLLTRDSNYSTALIVDGRRYAFGRVVGDPASSYAAPNVLAVAGTPTHEAVAVTYGGVTQRIDIGSGRRNSGRAAPLYRTVPTGSTDCGPVRLPRPYTVPSSTYPLRCRLTWRRVPFVSGPGWAPAGRSWLLFSIHSTGPGELRAAGKLVQTVSSSGRVTVRCADGSQAVGSGRPPIGPRNRDGVTVLACPATGDAAQTLAVTERLRAVAYGGYYDDGTGVDAAWRVSVG